MDCNIVSALLSRESYIPALNRRSSRVNNTSCPNANFTSVCKRFPFKKYCLESIMDMFSHLHEFNFITDAHSQRSKITSVVFTDELVCCVSESGLAGVFYRRTNAFLTFLNCLYGESIRSVHHNKLQKSIIVLSTRKADKYTRLHARDISIKDILNKDISKATAPWSTQNFYWPGFIDFDMFNETVLTFEGWTRIYHVWALDNYDLLYKLSTYDLPIADVIIGVPGLLVVIMQPETHGMKMVRLLNAQTGALIHTISIPVHRNHAVEWTDLMQDSFYLKERGYPLIMHNLANAEGHTISQNEFQTSLSVIHLRLAGIFLQCFEKQMVVRKMNDGTIIENFFDPFESFHDVYNPARFYFSEKDEFMVLHIFDPLCDKHGHMRMVCLRTGETIGVISCRRNETKGFMCDALKNISALSFHEESAVLGLGNHGGQVLLWNHRILSESRSHLNKEGATWGSLND